MRAYTPMLVALLLLSIVSLSQALTVEPSAIDEVLDSQKTVSVRITNDLNETLTVSIYSASDNVVPSTHTVTLSPYGSANISLTLHPSRTDSAVVYVAGSEKAVQNVKIRKPEDYYIVVSPSRIEAYTAGNKTMLKAEVYNPTDRVVSVEIITGLYISDDSFDLDPKERRMVSIEASVGEHQLTYSYDFGFKSGSVTQTIKVLKDESITQLENKIKDLESKLYLPDNVRINVPHSVKIGEELVVKVTSGGKALANVPVEFCDDIKFTDGSGTVVFTPDKVGVVAVSVLDRLGNIKVKEFVKVRKGKYNFSIGNAVVGKKIVLEFPEPGTVKIYRDLDLIKDIKLANTTFVFVPNDPGYYKIVYSSKSYEGATTFTVKGTVEIAVYVNGKKINNLQKITPGSTVVFKFRYNNGKPVKSGYAYVSLPLNMFGYSKRDAMLLAMTGSEKFTPPYNYRAKMRITNGQIALDIPDDAGEGTIIVEFAGDDLVESSSVTVSIAPSKPFYENSWVPYTLIGAAILAVTFKINPRDIRGKAISGIKRIFGRDHDLGI